MTTASIIPSKKSQNILIQYYRNIQNYGGVTRSEFRQRLERIDRLYQRELDYTIEHQRAKLANRAGDTTRYQNLQVPVVKPQVETATEYQASVFLSGEPLFGVVSEPKYADEAMQMESIIEDQSIRGGWARQLMMFFRDGFKHNFAPIELDWDEDLTYSIETNVSISPKEGIPKEIVWAGNKLKRLDPYNTFVDPRVPPTEVYRRGEFAGYTEFISRIELKSLVAKLGSNAIIANIKPAFESGSGAAGTAVNSDSYSYYRPQINSDSNEELQKNSTNWMHWAGLSEDRNKNIEYKDNYEVTKMYCKILPAEFDLKVPSSNTPQIYKLIIVNHEHIIHCERQTNAHGYIPIFIGQPEEDGLEYQTKSMAEDGEPFQELATTYMSSIIASRRRAISDRVLYDPSRIASAHINNPNPSAKMPVRPAAYGKNISEAVYQFPYREDQSSNDMQQMSMLLGLSNQLVGQNQASQGQFVKGNKTLQEFETVMANANSSGQVTAILTEFQVFIPMKHVIKTNILQYQGQGAIYDRRKQKVVEVDPIALRKAVMDFRISDGLIPSSKILNSENFAVALQVFGSAPQIAAGYNVNQLFSYMMKTQGADITEFEKSAEQVAFESAMQQWQQIAALALEKGDPAAVDKLPPQPKPEDYGYEPANNKPAPEEETDTQGA